MKTIIITAIALLVAWGVWWLIWGEDNSIAVTPDGNIPAETDEDIDLSDFDSKG